MASLTVHHYPARAITLAYLRAGSGLVLCGAPLVIAGLPAAVAAVFAGAACIFAAYAVQTALEQTTRITVSDQGIEVSGWRRCRLAWREISALSLAYYSMRRGRADGWMQLRLSGPGARVRLDSAIEDFEHIARRAAAAAQAQRLRLDAATRANLGLLGIDAGADGAR